jgi:uncharacterized membrane-anchored protein YjiN (DUF445 family)
MTEGQEMSDYQQERQTLAEMSRAAEGNVNKEGRQENQALAADLTLTPYEEFSQLVSIMEGASRQQQLKNEQAIQQMLQQAATALSDARQTDQISRRIQAMQQALTQQGPRNNPQYFLKMLQQLGQQLQEQLHQTDRQVAESLQQAVSSMAKAQTALSDSHSYQQLSGMVFTCEKTLQQWQNPGQDTVH